MMGGILLWYNRPFRYTDLVVPPEVSVIRGVYCIVSFGQEQIGPSKLALDRQVPACHSRPALPAQVPPSPLSHLSSDDCLIVAR